MSVASGSVTHSALVSGPQPAHSHSPCRRHQHSPLWHTHHCTTDAASVLHVTLPNHPSQPPPLHKTSRVLPTHRKGTKALRGDAICPKSNTCSGCHYNVDAGVLMLWDAFLTIFLNGQVVATPSLRMTLASPTS